MPASVLGQQILAKRLITLIRRPGRNSCVSTFPSCADPAVEHVPSPLPSPKQRPGGDHQHSYASPEPLPTNQTYLWRPPHYDHVCEPSHPLSAGAFSTPPSNSPPRNHKCGAVDATHLTSNCNNPLGFRPAHPSEQNPGGEVAPTATEERESRYH